MEFRQFENTRYLISDTGVVINSETGRELKLTKDKQGYLCVNLYDPSKRTARVHRMVALSFLPNPESYEVVNHKDGVKSNNNATNLEWATHALNTEHAYSIGLMKKGSEKSWAKLTESDVECIKECFVRGEPSQAIADYYGVLPGTISNIRSGRAWKSVRPDLVWENVSRQKSNRKICAADIPVIRKMFAEGASDTEIADLYKVHRGTIFQIRSGKNWKNY